MEWLSSNWIWLVLGIGAFAFLPSGVAAVEWAMVAITTVGEAKGLWTVVLTKPLRRRPRRPQARGWMITPCNRPVTRMAHALRTRVRWPGSMPATPIRLIRPRAPGIVTAADLEIACFASSARAFVAVSRWFRDEEAK